MKIKRVRFANGYKRFHDLTIDLGDDPKRIVALVGPNGCGKSSVLDGMLFHASAHSSLGSFPGDRDYRYHSMKSERHFTYQNVTIELVEGQYETVHGKKDRDGKGNTMFSFRSPYRYNTSLNVQQTKAVQPLRLNNYGASTAADIDAKMEENYRRLNVKFSRYRDENNLRPSDAKDKILGDLNASISKCLDLSIDNLGNIEAGQGSIFFSKPGHPALFDFNVLSSGEKEVVDILLDLYLRQDDYDETIFLIDEPELHISTSIQGRLLQEIDRLVGPKCQIWIATHSIGFLRVLQRELQDRCQIVAFDETMELASKAHTLTPMVSSRSNWRKIFAVPLDDLASLVSPTRIVYCEGRAEPGAGGRERGMDAQVFNAIFGDAYPDTLFISSGGNTELDQRSDVAIAILSKVYSNVEILVLKDRDMASGKFANEKDRQIYLANNEPHHRVLKRWEIENYLYDIEVIRSFCNKNSYLFNDEKYKAVVSDIVNQHVKDITSTVKGICGILTSISPEVFKIRLAECFDKNMAVYAELEDCIFKRD
ncbi:ATP-binding protein [Rhizobium sp. CG5]|uniref:AAA family ATPase n=1 Tax=Rhizobium sp. CG5 TaxID=2726076 RepID=UPI0020334134|nr:ATP-binding protein [Rhizobium sp. CG5]MCM2476542.1 ATP-binding protein [Rhizobium sp. CG5]